MSEVKNEIVVVSKEPTELIKVKQLPVIAEQLQAISLDIQAQKDEALALEATEANVTLVRAKRAELNKTFKDLEARRIAVKKEIMKPYDAFEAVYKKYVTDICEPADAELKKRIDSVDKILVDEKTTELKTYFETVAEEKKIDFLTFDGLSLKINRSASVNKLKTEIDDAVGKAADDVAVINTMEHSAEILVEYRQSLDLANAVLKVTERKERLAEELKRREEAEQEKKEAEARRKAEVEASKEPVEVVTPSVPVPAVVADLETTAEDEEMSFEPMPFELEDGYTPMPATRITVTAYSEAEIQAIIDVCNKYGLEFKKEVV